MDIVRIILIVAGLVLLLIEAMKKSPPSFSAGWLGAFLIGVAVLIQFSVK